MSDDSATTTRRAWLSRRAIATLAFALAMGWLVSRTCQAELASATIAFELADETAASPQLEVELLPLKSSERLANFRGLMSGAPPAARWPVQAQAGEYRLVIVVHGSSVRTYERTIELRDRATIHIPLGDGDAR